MKMKKRKYTLMILAALIAITGLLEHTIGSRANVNEWQHRGLYTDMFRPFLQPAFLSLVIIFIVVAVYSNITADEDMRVQN